MGRGRVRVKGAKGKRWRKGQSGGSNPAEVSHRQAARGKFGDHLSRGRASTTGPTGHAPLTAEALAGLGASHDEEDVLGRDSEVTVHEECSQSSHSTVATSAAASSAYTLIETAHPVFGAVKKLWNSPTESHRVICAVLAAVSEVVKTHDGNDTETEYFGALMSALESAEDEKSVAAIGYLLGLLIPSVPHEVLQVKYGTACRILTDQLTHHETTSSTALLKSLLQALTLLLQAQPVGIWSDSHCHNVFQTVLNFTVHPKPRLRKAAQGSVVSLLCEGTPSGDYHPAAVLTAKHCRHVLSLGGAETASLHVLGMLKACLANLPTQHLKSLCEVILKTMSLGSTMMRTTCLSTLHGLMMSLAGPQGITADLNARLISALHDQQPSVSDSQLQQAWLTVMLAAHRRLARLDQQLCMCYLARLFSACVACLLSHKESVTQVATTTMRSLLEEVVRPYIESMDDKDVTNNSTQLQTLQKTYMVVVKGLEYKFQQSWRSVLKTLSVFYRVAGKRCHTVMAQALPVVCSLHSLPQFKCTADLEEAVGVAVATMGPQVVLHHVPLQLDTDSYPPSFPRSWLLPVLRDHICHTQLGYFTDTMLPLAGRMRTRAEEYRKACQALEAKLYATLQYQVWFLLPGFCREPTDVSDSFPGLARILGTALTERPQLRAIIAHSLKQLVQASREKVEDRAVLARFSKNYLPILFNLYTSSSEAGEGERQPLLQCVQAYITITDQTLVSTFFNKVVEKIAEEDLEKRSRHRLLDLMVVMVPALPPTALQRLLDTISPLLDSVDSTLQKKGYKVLQELLSSEDHTHKGFIQDQLKTLTSALTDSLSTSATASKKPRLQCLTCLLEHIGENTSDFLAMITPEVILCTKEINEKCRSMAFQLLVNIGHTVQQCYGLSAAESVTQYMKVVLAGLAGSPHMVSATVISLSRLLYEFHDLLSYGLVSQLLSTMCTLLSSRTREVVKAAFGFIKITIGVLPSSELSPHLEKLVSGVMRWSGDPKSHFRLKARFILEKLMRKFGYEMISGLVPHKHHKLLAHIRKSTERQKKRKTAKEETGRQRKRSYEDLLQDSEEEGEELHMRKIRGRTLGRGTSAGKSRQAGSWIKERGGEDPINFLEPSIASRITSTDPREDRPRSAADQPFQTSTEGKLVITDDTHKDTADSHSLEDMETDSSKVSAAYTQIEGLKRDSGQSGQGGGGRGIHHKTPGKREFDYGSEYKAKRACGDVKVKGQPDPYAYVPLLSQKLNRRKQAKLAGQFSGVLKKAKSGSAAGSRQWGRKR